jgi:hypothetical protein
MTPQIESHLKANTNMRKRDIMVGNFLGGLSWGFGTVVGATLVVALLFYSLKAVGILDPFMSFFENSPAHRSLPKTD